MANNFKFTESQRTRENRDTVKRDKQDHYVCSNYKSGRGTCSAHYIREDVLREQVL